MAYSITKLKFFRGMDGHGFNVTICKDGKAVAFALDEGCGGMINWDWTNPAQNAKSWEANHASADARRAEFKEWVNAWYETTGKREEGQAQWDEWSKGTDREVGQYNPNPQDVMDSWLNESIDDAEEKKSLDRMSKKKTLFRLKGEEYKRGEWDTVAAPYDAAVQAFFDKKYPNQISEIYGVTA